MRIYISGPITNTPNYEQNFERAARYLHSIGHTPVNPVEVTPGCLGKCTETEPSYNEGGHTWGCYLRYDLIAMLECDAVYVLPNWEKSRGVALEVQVAQNCGLLVTYAEEEL